LRIMSRIGANAFEHIRRAALRSAPSSSRCQRDMSLRIRSHCISARRTLRCRRNGLSRCFACLRFALSCLVPPMPLRRQATNVAASVNVYAARTASAIPRLRLSGRCYSSGQRSLWSKCQKLGAFKRFQRTIISLIAYFEIVLCRDRDVKTL
jgi:hypothetical protein